ncbi:MAG: histidine--tRNA ligase [Spirochaetales bacterium]|jgi:histidyl-tRNA synthetase|nr:histidine--tRNA ligase [Spirochaetales bacterium]
MTLIEPKILKGFRDFLPAVETGRKHVQAVLEKTFESFGFAPIDTPVLEYTEVLLGKGGGETDKQLYRFRDNGDRDVAMRFDLTVPFARFMAAHFHDLYLPFKRYHIAKVFRGENSQRGRYREFTQCDFDSVGADCAGADFEILLLMRQSFMNLGIQNVKIHLSHRGVFNRAIEALGVESSAVDILRAVDKIKKTGEKEVLASLEELCGNKAAAGILDFIRPEATNRETLDKMTRLAGGEGEDTRRVASMLDWMRTMDIGDSFFLDPSITRGLDYYTGIVYETFLSDLPGIGSVCSGGRYNDLASLYTREKLPGVGSSIGLDRLLAALEELGQKERAESRTQVLIFCTNENDFARYHQAARVLREAGLNVEVYPEARKQAHQFAFAEKKGIPLGLFIKPEAGENCVSLRDLHSRENVDGLDPLKAAAEIKLRLTQRGL